MLNGVAQSPDLMVVLVKGGDIGVELELQKLGEKREYLPTDGP